MKNKSLTIALELVFILVFNIVFFVLGGASVNASGWIAYGFIHFSYFMLIITSVINKRTSNSAVLGFSLYAISCAYFLFEIIIGSLFWVINMKSYKASLIVQVVLTGIYFTLLLSHMIANKKTTIAIDNHKNELIYVKECSTRLQILMDRCSDMLTKKKIENLYYLIHSSQTKSADCVKNIENDVFNRIGLLEEAVCENDINKINNVCNEMIAIAEKRNTILKNNN